MHTANVDASRDSDVSARDDHTIANGLADTSSANSDRAVSDL